MSGISVIIARYFWTGKSGIMKFDLFLLVYRLSNDSLLVLSVSRIVRIL